MRNSRLELVNKRWRRNAAGTNRFLNQYSPTVVRKANPDYRVEAPAIVGYTSSSTVTLLLVISQHKLIPVD